jgi:hypothetical protein
MTAQRFLHDLEKCSGPLLTSCVPPSMGRSINTRCSIADTFHAWQGSPDRHSREGGDPEGYADIPGFCYSATLDEIKKHDFVLSPGR